jgi:hypothetical protein
MGASVSSIPPDCMRLYQRYLEELYRSPGFGHKEKLVCDNDIMKAFEKAKEEGREMLIEYTRLLREYNLEGVDS